ncbi:MAG TPA: tRNA (adenosine(37)-N6)-threonylcarbamoyltransferase complex ATPase subunit type 1 TsaE [Polyangiaceae bacterium]|nr:tRNA (adenosine(37)-N6)-threonylcarbamoyltransferase complex ATPase subunit type 1 TsaE [Polyangiaceae bacterium]
MTQPTVVILRTRRDTRRLGESIARLLSPGDLVILSGDLGAGKTFLARNIARALGATDPVTSPTFTLVHEHATPRGLLVHADLYRLHRLHRSHGSHRSDDVRADAERLAMEVARLGLREKRRDGALLVVEWGEDAIAALGHDPAVVVSLAIAGEHERAATLSGSRAGDIV